MPRFKKGVENILYENFFHLFHFAQLSSPISGAERKKQIKDKIKLFALICVIILILNLTGHTVSYRVATGCQRYADNRVASRESIQCVWIDICELLRVWHSPFVPGGSYPDLRSGGWHSIVQHAALQGTSSEAHPLFLVGGQRIALESHLSRQSYERRADEQTAQYIKLIARSTTLDIVPRTTGYTRDDHRRVGSKYEGREYVSRRNDQR